MRPNPDSHTPLDTTLSGLIPWGTVRAIRELAERKPRAEILDFPSAREYAEHKNTMSTALRDIRKMLTYIESDASGLTANDLREALKLIPCLSQSKNGEPLRCFPWHPKLRAMLCVTLINALIRDANASGSVAKLKKHLGPWCVSRWWP
jgi:hypothetical protein